MEKRERTGLNYGRKSGPDWLITDNETRISREPCKTAAQRRPLVFPYSAFGTAKGRIMIIDSVGYAVSMRQHLPLDVFSNDGSKARRVVPAAGKQLQPDGLEV